MKAILEYNLEEPTEAREATRALKALDLSIAIWDITQLLRNSLKYEGLVRNGYLTDDEYTVIEKIQEKVHKIIEEHDIKFVLDD